MSLNELIKMQLLAEKIPALKENVNGQNKCEKSALKSPLGVNMANWIDMGVNSKCERHYAVLGNEFGQLNIHLKIHVCVIKFIESDVNAPC